MSDDKVTDRESGISIRFVKQYDMKADLTPTYWSMCACGQSFRSAADFRAHWPLCPFWPLETLEHGEDSRR